MEAGTSLNNLLSMSMAEVISLQENSLTNRLSKYLLVSDWLQIKAAKKVEDLGGLGSIIQDDMEQCEKSYKKNLGRFYIDLEIIFYEYIVYSTDLNETVLFSQAGFYSFCPFMRDSLWACAFAVCSTISRASHGYSHYNQLIISCDIPISQGSVQLPSIVPLSTLLEGFPSLAYSYYATQIFQIASSHLYDHFSEPVLKHPSPTLESHNSMSNINISI